MHSESATSTDLEAGNDNKNENNNINDRVGTVVMQKSKSKFWLGVATLVSIAVIVGVAVPLSIKNKDKGGTFETDDVTTIPTNINEDTDEETINTQSPNKTVDITTTVSSNGEEDTNMGDSRPIPESLFDDEPTVTKEAEIMFQARKISVSLPEFDSTILNGYDHCDDLSYDIMQALGDLANIKIQYFMKNPYGPIMMYAMAESAPASDTSDTKEAGGEDSYGTNNQSDDVDEADLVKSNGEFVFVVYGGEILTLSPDKDGSVLSRLRLIDNTIPEGKRRRATLYWGPSEQINGLLLHGDTTLVATISSGYFYGFGLGSSDSYTDVVTMNISSETGELTIVDRTTVKGRYMAGRMIDTVAHLVTSSSIDHWAFTDEIARYAPLYTDMNETEYVEAAFARARLMIPKYASSMMQQLLPKKYDPAVDCRHIARLSHMQPSNEEAATNYNDEGLLNGFVRITSFDMSSELGASKHNLTAAFTPTTYADVYASRDMLFLGGQGYRQGEKGRGWIEYTYITAFELSGSTATPVATGIVPGYTLNQFSMDYYKDHLRIATSTREDGIWENGEYTLLSESTNQVMVTKIENDQIVIVGEVKDLGLDERIYAARFMEDRGFLVTFRQIDPFYTLDLSDPTNPQMKGELKIPGFSNYLHPVEETYVLAVGQDADEETGRTLGLQIALFDVSDFSSPRQIGKYVVPGWSSSESQYDHYAFRYLPQSKKLVLPVSRYGQRTIDGTDDEAFDGFHVYSITPDVDKPIGIDYVISHYDKEIVMNRYCYGQATLPSRSMVFQGKLMTLKGHSVMGHVLNTGEKLYYANMDEPRKLNSTDIIPCYGWFL